MNKWYLLLALSTTYWKPKVWVAQQEAKTNTCRLVRAFARCCSQRHPTTLLITALNHPFRIYNKLSRKPLEHLQSQVLLWAARRVQQRTDAPSAPTSRHPFVTLLPIRRSPRQSPEIERGHCCHLGNIKIPKGSQQRLEKGFSAVIRWNNNKP